MDADLSVQPLHLLNLCARRRRYHSVYQRLRLIATVQQTQPTIQLLLRSSDFVGALDLITTTQDVLQQELQGIKSFRYVWRWCEDGGVGVEVVWWGWRWWRWLWEVVWEWGWYGDGGRCGGVDGCGGVEMDMVVWGWRWWKGAKGRAGVEQEGCTNQYMYMCICMCVCVCACVYVCVHGVCVCAWCMCVHGVCVCACVGVCACVDVCAWVCGWVWV